MYGKLLLFFFNSDSKAAEGWGDGVVACVNILIWRVAVYMEY